tara:strand:+ start:259 stop:543 length:285 start_codon:yes stop_codon:yes gene_type:complete
MKYLFAQKKKKSIKRKATKKKNQVTKKRTVKKKTKKKSINKKIASLVEMKKKSINKKIASLVDKIDHSNYVVFYYAVAYTLIFGLFAVAIYYSN